MNKTYDLIVIGAGLSSLMFLNQYIKKFSSQSILLLEQKKIIKQDQTFCVWEGPGLQNITKNFKLKPKRIWKKIVVKNAEEEVIKDISPYKYVCFDGKEVLEKLLKDCKDKVTVINNRKVNKIIYKKSVHEIKTMDKNYYGKLIIDSRVNFKEHEIKSVFVKQAFIGHEIEVEHNTWNKNEVHLMSFKKNKNEIEFTYLLPFSSKRALIETTVFSSSPNLKHIGRRHQEILKQYGPYTVQREEKAIIPMAIIRPDDLIGVLKIGTSAGMVRASSGYSMRRIANWVLKLNNNEISINNLSQYKYQPNPLLNWLDKIFLNVIYNFPEKGPYLFVKLFSKADISALIRFLSDDASKFDLINILLSMPKKIMLKGLFKK
jgi:lycopene beta-cyclase